MFILGGEGDIGIVRNDYETPETYAENIARKEAEEACSNELVSYRRAACTCGKHSGKTARLWIRWNDDWVKMSVPQNARIDLFRSESTEEGWRSEYLSIINEGDTVHAERYVKERDCDGMYENITELECDIHKLRAIPVIYPEDSNPDVLLPNWQDIKTGFRDHSAERAGY